MYFLNSRKEGACKCLKNTGTAQREVRLRSYVDQGRRGEPEEKGSAFCVPLVCTASCTTSSHTSADQSLSHSYLHYPVPGRANPKTLNGLPRSSSGAQRYKGIHIYIYIGLGCLALRVEIYLLYFGFRAGGNAMFMM